MAPHEHQVPYGNLRSEFSEWDEESGKVSNLAIVYEVPGGSTNQINVTYLHSSNTFLYLGLDAQEERNTSDLNDVLRMVEAAIERIPAIRKESLLKDIDRWAGQGMGQRDLFQKMNKLLQIEDLVGGTITMHEMKFGIAHILAKYKPKAE
ncbi:MAG TPA: hypothetical protein VHV83_18750 [Armatimonadota bacterium]|nr:hypothetical protein [Armatimonadota bacterium]